MSEPKAVNKLRDLLHLHERRDLDSFISKKVMNWTNVTLDQNGIWWGIRPGKTDIEEVPYFHNDMAETRYVINKIQTKYPWVRLSILGGDSGFNGMFRVEWFGHPDPNKDTGERWSSVLNAPMELAVCLSIVELLNSIKAKKLK
jgi:hypothetical protein